MMIHSALTREPSAFIENVAQIEHVLREVMARQIAMVASSESDAMRYAWAVLSAMVMTWAMRVVPTERGEFVAYLMELVEGVSEAEADAEIDRGARQH